MRQFYLFIEKSHTLCDQLSWSHYRLMLNFSNVSEINYYIKICIEQNLSIRELRSKIKTNEYERLDDNTKSKLISNTENNIEDFIKNPILIKNSSNYEIISERY